MGEQENYFERMNGMMDLQYGLIGMILTLLLAFGTIGFLHMFMTESVKISKPNAKVKKVFMIILNSAFLVIYIMTLRATWYFWLM
jgi:hypothetical protein